MRHFTCNFVSLPRYHDIIVSNLKVLYKNQSKTIVLEVSQKPVCQLLDNFVVRNTFLIPDSAQLRAIHLPMILIAYVNIVVLQ